MRVYHINFLRLVKNLLPISLRKNFLVLFLRLLLEPIKWLHGIFISFRLRCLYQAQHNSQRIYLEAVLNDAFDNELRRIRIQNAVFKEPIFFYEPVQQKDVFFYTPENDMPVWLYQLDQFVGDGCDFYVFVPPDIEPNESLRPSKEIQIQGVVDFYKLYSKNYKIIWEQLND